MNNALDKNVQKLRAIILSCRTEEQFDAAHTWLISIFKNYDFKMDGKSTMERTLAAALMTKQIQLIAQGHNENLNDRR